MSKIGQFCQNSHCSLSSTKGFRLDMAHPGNEQRTAMDNGSALPSAGPRTHSETVLLVLSTSDNPLVAVVIGLGDATVHLRAQCEDTEMKDYISVVREPTAPFTDTHASIALEDEDIEMEDCITAPHDEGIEMEDSILEPLPGPLVQKARAKRHRRRPRPAPYSPSA
ncbi:hypothetical protein B0H11DRAFT_1939507 [Mycena galericulata]|nr:hypothetical protein B0H11DRAFT_1939507 [Mycena galericulata]